MLIKKTFYHWTRKLIDKRWSFDLYKTNLEAIKKLREIHNYYLHLGVYGEQEEC